MKMQKIQNRQNFAKVLLKRANDYHRKSAECLTRAVRYIAKNMGFENVSMFDAYRWEDFNIVVFNEDGDMAKVTVEDMLSMRKEEFVAYMEEYMDETNFKLLN